MILKYILISCLYIYITVAYTCDTIEKHFENKFYSCFENKEKIVKL